jgi:hypothetical protein
MDVGYNRIMKNIKEIEEVKRLNLILKAQQKILHNTQLEVAALKKKCEEYAKKRSQ